ncbi:DUF6884 domain-containing protein [Natrialbaceae archaeon A-chndr2]
MSTLLVQSCSKSKKQTSEPISALDLYSGYFFKIIKKSRREGTVNSNIDLCILSAKHGFVKPDEKIVTYDRRMDAQRAAELGPTMSQKLREHTCENKYKQIVINAGKEYRKAIDGFDSDLSVNTYHVCGDGLGQKGKALKLFLRGDKSGITRVN